jgi:hypothetical protein
MTNVETKHQRGEDVEDTEHTRCIQRHRRREMNKTESVIRSTTLVNMSMDADDLFS